MSGTVQEGNLFIEVHGGRPPMADGVRCATQRPAR